MSERNCATCGQRYASLGCAGCGPTMMRWTPRANSAHTSAPAEVEAALCELLPSVSEGREAVDRKTAALEVLRRAALSQPSVEAVGGSVGGSGVEFDRDVFSRFKAAMQEADRAFEAVGESGTKTYLREFLLPAMTDAGLVVADRAALSQPSVEAVGGSEATGVWKALEFPALNLIALQANDIAAVDVRFHDVTRAIRQEAAFADAHIAALTAKQPSADKPSAEDDDRPDCWEKF